jgi:hypothetical protein
MGNEEGCINLNKSDLIKLEFKHNGYYENQFVDGTIIFLPSEKIEIDEISIEIKMIQSFRVTELNNENSNGFLQQKIFFKRLNLPKILETSKTKKFPMKSGINKIPFKFFLPKNIPPSFEYPRENKKAFIRYIFKCEIISGKEKYKSEQYLIIKQRPFIYPQRTKLKLQDKKLVKALGTVTKGETSLTVFTPSKNIAINSPINYTIDIDNINCEDQVTGLKFKVIRTVTFKKDNNKVFTYETNIIKKKYSLKCLKNEKKENCEFNDVLLKDNDLKEIKFSDKINPYLGIISDLNLLMPSLETPIIKCEYKIIISLLFDSKVFKKDRPTIVVPIYAPHQTQEESERDKIIIQGQIKNNPKDSGIYAPVYNFNYEKININNYTNNDNENIINNNNINNCDGNNQNLPDDGNIICYDYPTLESINRAIEMNKKKNNY